MAETPSTSHPAPNEIIHCEHTDSSGSRGTIVSGNLILIRFATPKDFDQWLPLWKGYNAFYGRVGSTALDARVTQTTWTRFHDPHEQVYAIVAESGGKLVGLAHFLFHPSTISFNPHCYLHDLFVDEQMRGKGIGRLLIEAVYDNARKAGTARVYWQTHSTNVAARRLYDSLAEDSGFVVYRKLF